MEKNFELSTILTFTTGVNCTNDFGKVFELARFIYDVEFINDKELFMLKPEIKRHLLTLHPQLEGITYNSHFKTSFNDWLSAQKHEFGETLPVGQSGQKLSIRK